MKQIGAKGDNFNITNQYYSQASSDWNQLSEDEQKQWNKKARSNESGFILFVQNDLATFLAKQQN